MTAQVLLQISSHNHARVFASNRSAARKPFRVVSGSQTRPFAKEGPHSENLASKAVGGLAAAALLLAPQVSLAATRLPPVDSDPNRCERAFVGNTLGMANAVSDKLMDLRSCVYTGANLSDKVLSGALVSEADFSKTTMNNATMTKAYAKGANFSGADFTNAVLDRVDFTNANLSGTKFTNAVITGAKFEGANLDGATFEDALIGQEDYKQLCANPTVKGGTRVDIGCRTRP